MILEEISAHTTSVTIINSKEWAFGPWCRIFAFWPRHVQNNWNSVLIIIPLNALMSIRRITRNQSMTLGCKLRIFKIFKGIIGWWIVSKQWSSRNQPFELCLNNIKSRVYSSLFQHDLKLSLSFYLLDNLVVFVILIDKRILHRLYLGLFFGWCFIICLLSFSRLIITFTHDSCFTGTWQNRISVIAVYTISILVSWALRRRVIIILAYWWYSISLSGRYLSIRLVQSVLLCILIFRLGTTLSVWLKEGLFSCWETNKNCSCFSIPRLLIRRSRLPCIGEIVPFEFGLLTGVEIWRWNTIIIVLRNIGLIITCSDACNLVLTTLGDRASMVVLLSSPISTNSITANLSSLIWTGTNEVIIFVLHFLMECIHVTWWIWMTRRLIIAVFILISLGLLRNRSTKSFTGRSCILVVKDHILPSILEMHADGTIVRVFGLLRASIVLGINNLICCRINTRPIILENIALGVFPAVNRITWIF